MFPNPVGSNGQVPDFQVQGLPDLPGDDDGGGPITSGINILNLLLKLLGMVAKAKFTEIKAHQAQARGLHKLSAELQALIAELTAKGPEAKGQLSEDEIRRLEQLGVTVDGKSVRDFVAECGGQLNAGQLQKIKAEVDAKADTATDFVANQQLEIQQLMQKLNMCTTLIGTMQTMLKDLVNAITQGIR